MENMHILHEIQQKIGNLENIINNQTTLILNLTQAVESLKNRSSNENPVINENENYNSTFGVNDKLCCTSNCLKEQKVNCASDPNDGIEKPVNTVLVEDVLQDCNFNSNTNLNSNKIKCSRTFENQCPEINMYVSNYELYKKQIQQSKMPTPYFPEDQFNLTNEDSEQTRQEYFELSEKEKEEISEENLINSSNEEKLENLRNFEGSNKIEKILNHLTNQVSDKLLTKNKDINGLFSPSNSNKKKKFIVEPIDIELFDSIDNKTNSTFDYATNEHKFKRNDKLCNEGTYSRNSKPKFEIGKVSRSSKMEYKFKGNQTTYDKYKDEDTFRKNVHIKNKNAENTKDKSFFKNNNVSKNSKKQKNEYMSKYVKTAKVNANVKIIDSKNQNIKKKVTLEENLDKSKSKFHQFPDKIILLISEYCDLKSFAFAITSKKYAHIITGYLKFNLISLIDQIKNKKVKLISQINKTDRKNDFYISKELINQIDGLSLNDWNELFDNQVIKELKERDIVVLLIFFTLSGKNIRINSQYFRADVLHYLNEYKSKLVGTSLNQLIDPRSCFNFSKENISNLKKLLDYLRNEEIDLEFHKSIKIIDMLASSVIEAFQFCKIIPSQLEADLRNEEIQEKQLNSILRVIECIYNLSRAKN